MLNYINNGEIFMDNRVLFNIGYGLYVLTAQEGNQDNGCIINTVMQVTSDPCQIAIAVNKRNYTNQMIQNTKKFNISVLSENAKFDTFKHFGFQSGRDVDKFTTFNDIKRSPNGLLYITKDTNSYMSAFVKQEIDLGTHTLFIAQLVAAETLSDIPTATYTYYQQNIKPKPEKTEKRGWRCKICGFIYEGDDLPADYICPVCKHGAADFERIS
jgi:flavin reductase (DIM6/NTAB) family NADH-FMN oxidoreductase RutF